VVSLIPAAILASSAAVGLATYRRARPRLAVGVCKEVIVGAGSPTRVFSIVIDNAGHGGITVHDVGLHADGSSGRAVSVRRLREAGIAVQGPGLPHRIDGVKDHAKWKVDGAHAAAALGAITRVRGYVDLVRIRKRRTYTRLSSKWAEYNVSG
jgi:hypothetical protein